MCLPLLLALGCAQAPADPLIVAHGAGSGYWPENSRRAVVGSLEAGFDGIEIGVRVTADDVPVLWADAALPSDRCTEMDGSRLAASVLIADQTWEELRNGYLCGGLPDPEHPNSERVAASLLSLDSLVPLLEEYPDVFVLFDVEMDGPMAVHPDRLSVALLDRWVAADLPNPWLVASSEAETLESLQRAGATRGIDTPTCLGYTSSSQGTGYAKLARDANSDCISIPYSLADRPFAQRATEQGVDVVLTGFDARDDLLRRLEWPVLATVTDYPGDAP